jgi:hypothetical protein
MRCNMPRMACGDNNIQIENLQEYVQTVQTYNV